jgi:hypothetical protein
VKGTKYRAMSKCGQAQRFSGAELDGFRRVRTRLGSVTKEFSEVGDTLGGGRKGSARKEAAAPHFLNTDRWLGISSRMLAAQPSFDVPSSLQIRSETDLGDNLPRRLNPLLQPTIGHVLGQRYAARILGLSGV